MHPRSTKTRNLGELVHFRAERQQVPAEPPHGGRGSALNVPTKQVLNTIPFTAVQPRLHREPLGHDFHGAKPETRRLNSPMLNPWQDRGIVVLGPTFISFDNAFSQDTRL